MLPVELNVDLIYMITSSFELTAFSSPVILMVPLEPAALLVLINGFSKV